MKHMITSLSTEITSPITKESFPTHIDLHNSHSLMSHYTPQIPLSFSTHYNIMENCIGKGSSSIVKRCIRVSDKNHFAVKIIDKNNLKQREINLYKREINILKKLKNKKYIIKLEKSYETSDKLYLVLELCSGTDLFDWLKYHLKYDKLVNQRQVAYIFYQVVHAVHDCHKMGIIHRDIKPENILFANEKTLRVVLSDFGLSFLSGTSFDKMYTKCGSPNYVAPEIISKKSYGSKCDWWSCGVLLYVLLTGTYPFHNTNVKELYNSIVTGNYNFKNKKWKKVSLDAKHLVSNLLITNPKKRFGYHQIISHPFMQNNLKMKKKH